jgi:hypothetical protein
MKRTRTRKIASASQHAACTPSETGFHPHENRRRHRLHPDPGSLASALFFLMRDKGKSNRTVRR